MVDDLQTGLSASQQLKSYSQCTFKAKCNKLVGTCLGCCREGGRLGRLAMELQLWASCRGQLLARTVRGERAIQGLYLVIAASDPKIF